MVAAALITAALIAAAPTASFAASLTSLSATSLRGSVVLSLTEEVIVVLVCHSLSGQAEPVSPRPNPVIGQRGRYRRVPLRPRQRSLQHSDPFRLAQASVADECGLQSLL